MQRVGACRWQAGHAEGALPALVRSIVFQQLSGKAAETIYGRVRALFPPSRFPKPHQIQAVSDESLRACGLSGQKLGYLRDLCEKVGSGQLDLDGLSALGDQEVIEQLTQVRGIGRWSAQMFLMFYLGRLDVWPDADLGIRSALRILHGHDELPTAKAVAALAERYRPYGSVASWYLWRLLELPEDEHDALRDG